MLRALIDDPGPSVSELARDAGGDRSVLSRFLAGQRTITLETAPDSGTEWEVRVPR